ncbi:MAG: PocR ligand-binding domain-containing protein [Pseudodesulfovibrio sp.]|nr:PocR ligand-binding domain-containing protein [Pseudodesulfovibrio sp.]
MKLTDYKPLEWWVSLQNELHERYGLNADVMDREGKRIAGNTWGNKLCKAIRNDAKGLGAICAPAGQMFLHMMQTEKKPLAEECDAGMLRVSVPIFKDGEFLGAVGGCGLMPSDGEIEEYMVEMSTDLDEGKIAALAQGVVVANEAKVAEILEFIGGKVAEALG